jgi:hypothetical protein
MPALPFSSFPGARQQTGMGDWSENSAKTPYPLTPFPSSLSPGEREEEEGSRGEG